eukprot:gene5303-7366_t
MRRIVKSYKSCGKFSTAAATKVMKGELSPMRTVPDHIVKPEYAESGKVAPKTDMVYLYDEKAIKGIRTAARLARKMLEYANSLVEPGITTDEIDRLTHLEIIRNGAYPTPLNYGGFPKSICTSVNEVICHGIPDNRPLVDGDIVSIDVSLYIGGFHGDNCGSVVAKGKNSIIDYSKSLRLIDTTKEAVYRAIEKCKPGNCLTEIGATIEEFANKNNYQVVHEFCGHGTGVYIHMKPLVLPHRNREEFELTPGMVFTIEPILVQGKRRILTWPDKWTAATVDGSWGAQVEHEVLITETGVEVLTLFENNGTTTI